MIDLDFQVDEEALADSLEGDITQDHLVCFVTTMFIMPVRFKVEEVEIFKSKKEVWSYAPIMNLASEGLLAIKKLKLDHKSKFNIIEGPGDIEFTFLNPIHVKVDFYNGSEHIIVITKYKELLEAFQKYADKVRKFMWERVLQLNEHPYWGPWLRGERD